MESEFNIGNDFIVKNLNKKEFFPLFEKYRDVIFSHDHSLHFRNFLSEGENKKIKELGKGCYNQPFSMNLAVFDKKENFVG